ncbi:hypothetical protein LCGC14_2190750 [marine sediment metagenome]|uniref:Uncharacterized protein n=1 Tax=marine sediment metagenome TaxID=412755 RepID=A0A0F8Y1H1_9ZZZZ
MSHGYTGYSDSKGDLGKGLCRICNGNEDLESTCKKFEPQLNPAPGPGTNAIIKSIGKPKNHSPLSRESVRENKEEVQSEVTRSSASVPAGTLSDNIGNIPVGKTTLAKSFMRTTVYREVMRLNKEFIRELKDGLDKKRIWSGKQIRYIDFLNEIDKLTGDDLIKW